MLWALRGLPFLPASWPGLLALTALCACDMQPAETLDRPRVLALKTEPAVLAPGEVHVLTALTFEVPGELEWSLCAVAWSPTEPLSCPTGAIPLGRGNPLSVTLPADLTSGWLEVAPVADGSAPASLALPAVKRLDAAAIATNPEPRGLVSATGPMPTNLANGDTIDLMVDLGDVPTPTAERLVVSWYTTAGALDPGRTLATETATLEAPGRSPEGLPSAPTDTRALRVIAVVRDAGGGTGWTEATLSIGATSDTDAP